MSSPGPTRVSPAVYRRRRAVALLILIVVVALIVLLIWRPWSSSGVPAASPAASSSAPAQETPTGTAATSSSVPSDTPAADPEPCTESQVSIGARTDAGSYGEGDSPELSLSVTNTGDAACELNVGTSQQQFVITSGSETYWRSTDCQSDSSDAVVTLEPGKTVSSSTPITWDRVRSTPESCDDDERPAVPAGGATYHLETRVGDFASASTASFVLN
ncbi:MAG: DUF4232 domain-containing protein [Mycetocola sp.]